MTHRDEDDIGAQVSSRLDEMFGEEDTDEPADRKSGPGENAAGTVEKGHERKAGDDDAGSGDSPLKNLKALVFGIDWEITDDGMRAFLEEVRRLQARYQHDKVLSTFLKLHESVGKYIRAKKARAHPGAFKFVASVFQNFEKVFMTPDMPESNRKRLLSGEIRNFRNFKEQIAAAGKPAEPASDMTGRSAEKGAEAFEKPDEQSVIAEAEARGAEEQEPTAEDAPGPDDSEKDRPAAVMENQEAIDYIVSELKKAIKAEFHTIRQIIKNLGA